MSREELLQLLHKTLAHFFPKLRRWLDTMPDPRDASRITYPFRSLLWSGVLMFLFHLRARRRLRYDFNSASGLPNLNRLAETELQTLPHPDTLVYLLKNLSPDSLDRLRRRMVRRLLRKRCLERFRLFDRFYLVAIDGTRYLSFRKAHCEQCLRETLSNGATLYYHPVVEAKLVCANGLAMSLGTEFLQNTDGQKRQDCELKAFYRFLPRLRAAFRGLPAALARDPANAKRGPAGATDRAPSLPVAIQRCETYEPGSVRKKINTALDLVGGMGKLVGNKTVTIKLNLTGGPKGPLGGLPAYRTYHVHPNVVAALCAAVHDAGARRIFLVESQNSRKSPEEVLGDAGWDVAAIKSAGGHRVAFEDTRNRGRWPAYSRLKVSWGGFIFPAFDVNQRYEKTDVFISLGKMKDHAVAGVTLSVKNLFGITPTSLYGNEAPKEDTISYRGAILHVGTKAVPAGVPAEIGGKHPLDQTDRVPRVIADIIGARPVDLAVVDGVETCRGGEGPWIKGVEPTQPKLLVVGRNAVCTDSVCTAAMGYDPEAAHGQSPFRGENHLELLASVSVGEKDVRRIEIVGLPLKEAIQPFNLKP